VYFKRYNNVGKKIRLLVAKSNIRKNFEDGALQAKKQSKKTKTTK